MNDRITDPKIVTILNGELTELTEDEITLILEYRMANEEEQAKIREIIENAKTE